MPDQAYETCDGFAWIGQSVLCCDDCGQPWFLHPGDATYVGLFPAVRTTKPFSPERQAQIPALIAAWEANALWQRERPTWRLDTKTQENVIASPERERQVGKDFPYATGPTRPVQVPQEASRGR